MCWSSTNLVGPVSICVGLVLICVGPASICVGHESTGFGPVAICVGLVSSVLVQCQIKHCCSITIYVGPILICERSSVNLF